METYSTFSPPSNVAIVTWAPSGKFPEAGRGNKKLAEKFPVSIDGVGKIASGKFPEAISGDPIDGIIGELRDSERDQERDAELLECGLDILRRRAGYERGVA